MRSAVLASIVLAAASVVVAGFYVAQEQQVEDVSANDIPLDLPGPTPTTELAHDKDLGEFAGDVVPRVQAVAYQLPLTATAAAAAGHNAAFHDAAWWAQRNPQRWVVQVLAAGNEQAVQQYIAAASDADQYSYYQDVSAGQPWYIVVYGDYPTQAIAAGVAETHDFGSSARPDARSVAMIQADQVAATAQDAAAPASAAATPSASAATPVPAPATSAAPPAQP